MKRSALAVTILCMCMPGFAQTPPGKEDLLGSFTDWRAMRYDDGGKVCSMWADDQSRTSGTHAFVAHRVQQKSFHEITVQLGTPLKSGSTLEAVIGSQRFKLYVDGDSAWNNTAKEDLRMVRAMRAGATLKVRGTTRDGRSISRKFSLKGFTAAHKALNKACNVRF